MKWHYVNCSPEDFPESTTKKNPQEEKCLKAYEKMKDLMAKKEEK